MRLSYYAKTFFTQIEGEECLEALQDHQNEWIRKSG